MRWQRDLLNGAGCHPENDLPVLVLVANVRTVAGNERPPMLGRVLLVSEAS